jgi:hypothetical protein
MLTIFFQNFWTFKKIIFSQWIHLYLGAKVHFRANSLYLNVLVALA